MSSAWIKTFREKYRLVIDGGYREIRGKTIRVSNMGDETPETITALLADLDDSLPV